jgi:CDP-diacylglycerol--glycerol-3-phosphate 3-phosphatidyltransferase
MNLPNKLTLLRVVMIPLLVVFMLVPMGIGWQKWIAVTIFVLASLTDLADGKIARRYNLITNFGKFMDPLADKLLVCSALICLIELHKIPAWVVLVIIAREFIVSGFRLVAVDQGVVIAASMWGKVKTTVQMIMIILMLADLPQLATITQIAMWAALVLTVVSLVDYVVKNRAVIKDVR